MRLARLDRRRRLEIADDPGAVSQLVGDETERGVGDLGEIDGAPALVVAAGEHLQSAHDLRHPVGAALRFRHRILQLGHQRRLLRCLGKLLGEDRQVGDDRSERIVDLVRDARGQGPERRGPLARHQPIEEKLALFSQRRFLAPPRRGGEEGARQHVGRYLARQDERGPARCRFGRVHFAVGKDDEGGRLLAEAREILARVGGIDEEEVVQIAVGVAGGARDGNRHAAPARLGKRCRKRSRPRRLRDDQHP